MAAKCSEERTIRNRQRLLPFSMVGVLVMMFVVLPRLPARVLVVSLPSALVVFGVLSLLKVRRTLATMTHS